MIERISPSFINTISSDIPSSPKFSTTSQFPDTLVTHSFNSTIGGAWTTFKGWACACVQFLKQVFCCCFNYAKESDSLIALKQVLAEFPRKIQQLKKKDLSRHGLTLWWKRYYDSLTPHVQRLLLLEDIKLRSPDGVDEHEWAQQNYKAHRGTAVDFVVNLYVQTEKSKELDPLDDLPDYITNVIRYLEQQG